MRQLRRTRTLADESAEVELSLDDVEVVARGRVVERFLELEVELRRGPASALDTLAAILAADPDLAAVTSSKLERALAAAGAAAERHAAALQAPPAAAGPRSRCPAGARQRERPGRRIPRPRRRPGVDPPSPCRPRRPRPPHRLPRPRRMVRLRRARPRRRPRPAPTSGHLPRRPHPARQPSRQARLVSSSASRRASRPTTCSPRPAARCSGSTSPACWPGRPARATARTSRTSTACASPRAGCGPHGGSSATGFRANRTNGLRSRLRVLAGRLGAVRDLDVLIEAAVAHQAAPGRQGCGGLRAARRGVASRARGGTHRPRPRARQRGLPAPRRGVPGLRGHRGSRRRRAGEPGHAPPRPRHGRLAHLAGLRAGAGATSRSCAGRTSRPSTSCGSPASGCATRWSSSGRRWGRRWTS